MKYQFLLFFHWANSDLANVANEKSKPALLGDGPKPM